MKSSEFFDINNKFTGSDTLPDIPCKNIEKALELSNTYNRSLIESSLDPLIIMEPDGKIIDVNNATEQITGYSRDDLIGTDFSDYFIEPEKVRKCHEQACIYDKVWNYYLEIKHKDGHVTPVLYNASVYKNESEVVIYIFATARNITERKTAEEALKKAYENLEKLVEERTIQLENAYKSLKESEKGLAEAQKMAHIGNWDWNLVTNELYYSDELYRIFGLKPQELNIPFDAVLNYIHPYDQENVINAIKEAFNGKRYASIDFRIIRADGKVRAIRSQGKLSLDEKNNPIRIIGTAQDITERKKAEEKLRESEERYRVITEQTGQLVYENNLETNKVSWAGAVENVFGYTIDEVKELDIEDWFEHIHPEDRNRVIYTFIKGREAGIAESVEYRLRKKDGTYIYIEDTGTYFTNEDGKPFRVLGVVKDITEQKLTREQLEKSEERYRIIVERTGQLVYDYDIRTNQGSWTGAIEEITGYTTEEFQKFYGSVWSESIHPEDREQVAKTVYEAKKTGNKFQQELRFKRKDGTYIYIEDSGIFLLGENGRTYRVIGVMKNITERKLSQKKLQESEEKYRNIVETANEGIVIIDDKFRVTFANHKMTEMFGYDVEESIGRSLWDYMDGKTRTIVEKNMEKWASGIIETFEIELTCKDGSSIWALVNSKPLINENGKSIGVLAMLTDITERKKAEEKRLESEEKYRNIIETTNEGIVITDTEFRISYINENVIKKGGYLPEEVIGRLWWDFTDEEGKAIAQLHKNKRQEGSDETYELKVIGKDGFPFWILISSKSLHDKDGKFTGSLSTFTDITERKKAEEKIKSLAKIVESSNDAIITTSPEGVIESWNKGAEQVYGYLAEEILGKNISILEPNSSKGEIKYLANEIEQGKKVQGYETSRLKKDGTVITVSVTLSPIFDQAGRFIAISCIAGDITEKKMTEKLLQEKQMAEVANSTKNDFLASISHELRTPLNSIIGFSDMLYEQAYGNMTEKQLSSIKNISQSGKHLLNLINNILDISKIEAGKMELVYKDFELIIKLNMIRNILYPIASKKDIKIDIDVDSNLTTICADEEKFVQIMYNLVDNAIKFSYESSPVKITARKKGDMVEITVRDAGIGIKAKDHCKLFKPFSQIHSSSPRKTQGTGLGLSLVKQIVHLHGGYVWFRSNPGSGSIFAFVIPINCQLSCRSTN